MIAREYFLTLALFLQKWDAPDSFSHPCSPVSIPIIKLPTNKKTEPFKNASYRTSPQENSPSLSCLLAKTLTKINLTIIAGDSIKASAATMCPP
jgi:hypothetical protein